MDPFNRLKHLCLLLIDDDEWVRDSLKLFFENEGCRVAAFGTAREGLAYAADHPIDILIVDYHLPDMNGLELIKNAHPNLTASRKVLMTAHPGDDLAARAGLSGADQFIRKPLTGERLTISLNRLFPM